MIRDLSSHFEDMDIQTYNNDLSSNNFCYFVNIQKLLIIEI